MSAVTHFEIYGEEPAKLAEFYRSLFGWQIDASITGGFKLERATVGV
jgi:predicted enzyme related to lactoylglutathione lyase